MGKNKRKMNSLHHEKLKAQNNKMKFKKTIKNKKKQSKIVKENTGNIQNHQFTEFLKELPNSISNYDLMRFFSCRKSEETETNQLIDRVLRCLQSDKPSTQQNAYITLFLLLKTNPFHFPIENIINKTEEILVTDGNNSKGEKRLIYTGRVLGFGAIIRSKRLKNFEITKKILDELLNLSEKRKSIQILSTSFIIDLLTQIPVEMLEKIPIDGLQNFLNVDLRKDTGSEQHLNSKKDIGSILHTSFVIGCLGLKISVPLIENIGTIVENVLRFVKYEDKKCLQSLIEYLRKTGQLKGFWREFGKRMGPYHFELLYTLIVTSVEESCPISYILTKEILLPIVNIVGEGSNSNPKALHKNKDEDLIQKALHLLHILLDFNSEQNFNQMSSKERLKVLKILFDEGKIGNKAYRLIHGILMKLLNILTADEIGYVAEICEKQSSILLHDGNSALPFLTRLLMTKNCPQEIRNRSLIELFKYAFCEWDIPAELSNQKNARITPEVCERRRKASRLALEAIMPNFLENVSILYNFVNGIVTGKNTETKLEEQPTDEVYAEFKILKKLLHKVKNDALIYCLKAYGIYLLFDSTFAMNGLKILKPLCEESVEISSEKEVLKLLIQFIMTILQEKRVIINHVHLFQKLLRDGKIDGEIVQSLITAIDMDFGELNEEKDEDNDNELSKDETNDSELSDDEPSDDELNEIEAKDIHNKIPVLNSLATNGIISSEGDLQSDEESLNMDEMEDEELKKMDSALSSVFSTKKEIKEKKREKEIYIIRILNLINLYLKRYQNNMEDPTIPLLLVVPIHQLLLQTRKQKKLELQGKVVSVLHSLNEIRKITGKDVGSKIDTNILKDIIEDTQKLLKKKLQKKERMLIRGSLEMIQRLYKNILQKLSIDEIVSTPKNQKSSKIKHRKRPNNKNVLKEKSVVALPEKHHTPSKRLKKV